MLRRVRPQAVIAASGPAAGRGGDGDGRRRRVGRPGPVRTRGGRDHYRQAASRPPDHPQEGDSRMGSSPTLDQRDSRSGQDDDQAWDLAGVTNHLAAHHPQVRSRPDDNPYAAHDTDHRDRIYDYPHPVRDREAREFTDDAFARLNPDFGVPADHTDLAGQRATHHREAGLSLGTRVAVAASRENDSNPILTIPGQDYRASDAARAARLQLATARHDPAQAGAER